MLLLGVGLRSGSGFCRFWSLRYRGGVERWWQVAMSKEQQREAGKRIMGKHLLTEEDRKILVYKPSPAQWAEAYEKIQEGKERGKAREKEPK
jgi:hypothetical protein